jgi:hypothetical protein
MNDHTPKSPERQLSLFEPQFDARIRRVEIEGVMHFSIYDIFEIYETPDNARRKWKQTEKRLKEQGFDAVSQMTQYQFCLDSGKKTRSTPIAPLRVIFRIAQTVVFKDWETLRVWMADVAHERLEEMKTPGLGTARAYRRDLDYMDRLGYSHTEAAEHLRTRIETVDTFKSLTAHIDRVCNHRAAYGMAINQEYLELFGKVAAELKEILRTDKIRDALPELQLRHVQLAELDLTTLLKHRQDMTIEQLIEAVIFAVRPLGDHLKTICNAAGIDVITGKRLLGTGE